MLTTPDGGEHSELTKAENDGKASDGNDPEMGKTGKWSHRGVADGEEWETSLVRVRSSTAAVPPTGDRSKNRG